MSASYRPRGLNAVDDEALQSELTNHLRRVPDLELAWLFGSVAARRSGPRSDIDVAVVMQTPIDLDRRITLAQALEAELGRVVDLVDLRQTSGVLLAEVLTKGKLLVQHDVHLHANLLTRMWGEEADFMPQYRAMLAQRRMVSNLMSMTLRSMHESLAPLRQHCPILWHKVGLFAPHAG
ncbi:MAG: nucleotidyltransferase domain-containing protein [Deltaproteobacteria bacterium]|nr:MAG: nucleotidyltransferase domain-containing protein [Deltaproteobacteria bacterium]